jgi:hypothetical protein
VSLSQLKERAVESEARERLIPIPPWQTAFCKARYQVLGIVQSGIMESSGPLTICNIRDIVASIALSRYVDCETFHSECIDKVLEEPQKLSSDLHFVGGRLRALAETCADWLLDPYHVGQICPAVCVWDGFVGSFVHVSIRYRLSPPPTYHIATERVHSLAGSLPRMSNQVLHSTKL